MKGLLCMAEEFEMTQQLSEDEIEYKKRWVFEQIIKINEKDKCEVIYGFQQPAFYVPVSSGSSGFVLCGSEEGQEPDSVCVQPVLLCMGRAEVCIFDVVFHHNGLYNGASD